MQIAHNVMFESIRERESWKAIRKRKNLLSAQDPWYGESTKIMLVIFIFAVLMFLFLDISKNKDWSIPNLLRVSIDDVFVPVPKT